MSTTTGQDQLNKQTQRVYEVTIRREASSVLEGPDPSVNVYVLLLISMDPSQLLSQTYK